MTGLLRRMMRSGWNCEKNERRKIIGREQPGAPRVRVGWKIQ